LVTQNELPHKIRGRGTIIETSLYADDATVFVDPKKEIQNLSSILTVFGEATVSSPTSKRVWSFPLDVMILTLTRCLMGFQ
jgi:hypothetical protein